jgi:MFS superfamily sulfate permease-like transporter
MRRETENPNIPGSVALGLMAGAAAGLVWYLVQTLTGYTVGYIALGAGWLVGQAVMRGAGKKRGSALQLISVAITLAAIVGASYFSLIHQVNKFLAEKAAEKGTQLASQVWISPLSPLFWKSIISPMGLLIWGIGLYIAFRIPQPRKL